MEILITLLVVMTLSRNYYITGFFSVHVCTLASFAGKCDLSCRFYEPVANSPYLHTTPRTYFCASAICWVNLQIAHIAIWYIWTFHISTSICTPICKASDAHSLPQLVNLAAKVVENDMLCYYHLNNCQIVPIVNTSFFLQSKLAD